MIYLDNAATTLRKPRAVRRECARCLKHYCANSGRGGHQKAFVASEKILECRESLAQLFNIKSPEQIIFTHNTTHALNIAIRGILKPGLHAVITGMEHNSVLRPVAASGADFSVAMPDELGTVSAESVEEMIRENTALIVVTHASNITGTINPIYEIGTVAKRHGIPFLVDAAQTAGVLPIDCEEDNISLLAFAGHKMLYGPTGTGGLYVSPSAEESIAPFVTGGTGSLSESELQPDFLPDKFESGTMNILGIAGLNEGVKFVSRLTPSQIANDERRLTGQLIDGLLGIRGLHIHGGKNRVGVVGFSMEGTDSVYLANALDEKYGIACRGGLHCAALAHKSMGTLKHGITRLSVSHFTTENEIDKAVEAVKEIIKGV